MSGDPGRRRMKSNTGSAHNVGVPEASEETRIMVECWKGRGKWSGIVLDYLLKTNSHLASRRASDVESYLA